ncbi:MAG TPA: hypothetical protein VK559_10935 [Ferruginibacter sp.]|nr:hypothetical protein [Ferruginibacter sp.]
MIIIGIVIGFYGYLFPGNINIMAMDLYNSKKYKLLVLILSLIVLFECIYCSLTLLLLEHIKTNMPVYNKIQLVAFFLTFVMGLIMVLEKKKNNLPHQNTFYRGLFSIFIHPQQIPFWFVVGIAILPAIKFDTHIFSLVGFVFFVAIGTFLAMCLYMRFGARLLRYFHLNLFQINKLIGVVYLIIGGYSFSSLLIALLTK